jgi:hypothetical protein
MMQNVGDVFNGLSSCLKTDCRLGWTDQSGFFVQMTLLQNAPVDRESDTVRMIPISHRVRTGYFPRDAVRVREESQARSCILL